MLPWWLTSEEPACQCRRGEFNHWVRKIPWRRKWQPTPVFLPGKSHGKRSLVGYSPWGRRVEGNWATEHASRGDSYYFGTIRILEVYPARWSSLVAQMVQNLPAMQETWVGSLGQEDPLEKSMATHSSILAWRIPMDKGVWWATVHGIAKRQT